MTQGGHPDRLDKFISYLYHFEHERYRYEIWRILLYKGAEL